MNRYDYMKLSTMYLIFFVWYWFFGFWYATLLQGLQFALMEQIISRLFGIEMLDPKVEIESAKFVNGNLIASAVVPRFNLEDERQFIFRRTDRVTKLRSQVVKRWGRQVWAPLPLQKRKDLLNKLIVRKNNLSDEKARKEFMVKELSVALEHMQWKVFLIEDYSATESCIIYKCHHSLKDELARLFKTA